MTDRTPGEVAAHFITAIGHLLIGSPGQQTELNQQLAIICGAPVPTLNLVQWTDWVRRSGCDIVHFSFHDDCNGVPTIAMVFVADDGRSFVFEHCWLWLPQSGGRCWLIPDGDDWGAYRLDDDLKLCHHPRAPARGKKARRDGYVRAHRRFADILDEQRSSGVELPLPERLRFAA